MPLIVVRLADILTSASDPIDLSALPPDEAEANVRRIYDFLPEDAQVSVEDDVATIDIPEESAQRAGQAMETHERAVKLAARGRYQSAIKLFQDVLDVLPNDLDARRNLAMAYMELGDNQATKRHLLQVLQLSPQDAQALLIMGNLYAQAESDLDTAERFYEAAHRVAPEDAYILSSYGGLKAKRGDYDAAREMFEQAIEIEPDYPNPWYGLALVHAEQGDAAATLTTLDRLFDRPKSEDARRDPVYREARALCRNASERIAHDTSSDAMDQLEQVMDAFADETGHPIHIMRDESLSLPATAQLAWVYDRPYHTIRYKPTDPALLPHLVAHEFEHIRMAHAARQAGRSRLFTTNERTKATALRYASSSTSKLRRMGLPSDAITTYIDQVISGLANQLLNIPMDMFIEHTLYPDMPFLRPSQLVSLHATHQEALKALTDPSVKEMAPNRVYDANVAMNCAYALFTDSLFGGATAYAEPYLGTSYLATGRKLMRAWEKALADFAPGDEYDLVDRFADILRLQGWYEWAEDRSASEDTSPQGNTNTELLKEKQPAAVMYCLSAVRRFADVEDDTVRQIVTEIAMLGQSGLDYASSEKQYTLRSLPGESFSGLELMCLMHVGLKRIDPQIDPGTDLDDAYEEALRLHHARDS